MSNTRRRKGVNYAFIDSQNLNLGIRSQGWRLDFVTFRRYLRDKYQVEKAFLFIGYLHGNEKLYLSLQEAGYILIFKPTLEIKQGAETVVKGNVDAELVLHTMIEYLNYAKAVVVSGDGDFHCLIEYLVGQKKLLKVLAPTKHYSSLLREFNAGNYIVRLDLLRATLAKKRLAFAVGRNLRLVQSS